jgi:hypothetical protein
MYIVRKTNTNGDRFFKTYDGWVPVVKGEALDLSDVQRFTKREALDLNILPKGEEFIWFGCYKKEI